MECRRGKAVLEVCQKERKILYSFFTSCNNRNETGGIPGLLWEYMDLENRCVRITQTLSSDGNELLPYTKTRSGPRTIDLPEETVTALKKHWLFIRGER
ncbi:hypothetical protein [Bacillus wiedmannii]|uniref:hypothetical protein n=1 Tax=Bacillus wiedmannii TaxID=1890302 RepID=UPI0011553F72|nr:hypothetical protein [Bacillus wiedmannii]